MATNYTGVDLDRYNEGNKFLSQDNYLQNYQTKAPITFNPSQSNTGIMSQYPYPYPIIPQEGGEGGDGETFGLTGPGYGYTSPGGNLNPDGSFINADDFGEGTIPYQDMPKGPGLSLMDMVRAGGAYMFGGPLNTMNSLRKSNNRNKQIEIDKINARIEEQYGPGDSGLRGNDDTPGFGKTAAGNYTNQFDGGDPGQGQEFDGPGEETADNMYAYGGRAGYRDGGLTEYEVFKLGELGYNTKGGTVLEPFGGIKVLKNILRVNKYAYGGIVGMYR